MKKVPYKRIMVALDLSELDEKLIQYALWFANTMRAEKVYFVHFFKKLTIPKKAFVPDLDDTPLDEKIGAGINRKIKLYSTGDTFETEIVVQEEFVLEGLLRWQKIKNIDLLLVGKKNLSRGSGVISRQFIRQSSCPVLFVPSTAKPKIEKILVPIDFSLYSGYALSQALHLYPYLEATKITCQHVYFGAVQVGKWKINSQYPKYVHQSALENSENFLKEFELKDVLLESVFTPDEDVNVAPKVLEYAELNNMDLVVIGAKGHSKIKLLTVGSTAEKMMLSALNVPLLVVNISL